MALLCIKAHSANHKEHSDILVCESLLYLDEKAHNQLKYNFIIFQAIELLKVNQGTQIRVSPSLSRDMQHTHSIIEPPAQIGVNMFFEMFIFISKNKKT